MARRIRPPIADKNVGRVVPHHFVAFKFECGEVDIQ
jgi:hypothetical protein